MWGKKKDKEKKPKWWKSNESDNFNVALGANYKVIRGLMMVVMAGLILMGISVVFRQTTAAYNLDAFRGLIISGAVITGFGMIGVFITLFTQIRQTKAAERNNKNKMEMKMKLAEAEKKYNESQKDIIADNKRLEEIKLKQERKNKKLD